MKAEDLAHEGDPCKHCETPHDEVKPGPCPARIPTIEGVCREYLHKVVPPRAPFNQRHGTTLAFWGGAVAMFSLMNQASELDEDLACKILDSFNDEFQKHMADMQNAPKGHG